MKPEQFYGYCGLPATYASRTFKPSEYMTPKVLQFGLDWCDKRDKESLILQGNVGSGKTYFMCCLINNLLNRGHTWLQFKKSSTLDREFLEAVSGKSDCSLTDLMSKYKEVPIFFWDDIGTERVSERVEREFLEIIDYRLDADMPIVFTTNLDFEKLEERLGERISSRLQKPKWLSFKSGDMR